MPIVIARWPDSTISIIKMRKGFSEWDLLKDLDMEADPDLAKCVVLQSDDDGLHITTHLVKKDDGSVRLEVNPLFGKMRKFRWTDITE